jgi:HK97 family phage major capsid protein
VNTQEFEKLMQQVSGLQGRLTELVKKNGQENGVPKVTSSQKEELERWKEAVLTDVVDKVVDRMKAEVKMPFGDTKGSEEQKDSFGRWLLKVKIKHPEIAERYLKTMSEGVGSEGGYTVPEDHEKQIMGALNDSPTIVQKCTPYPQNTDVKNIPKWLTDMIVGWVTEKGIRIKSTPTLERKQSVLGNISAIVTFTDQYLQDDISNIGSQITKLVGENFGLEIERVALMGNTGSGDPFNGLFYTPNVNKVPQSGGSLQYEDIVKIWNNPNVLEKYRSKGCEWYMNRTALGKIMLLVDNNNRPLWSLTNAYGKPANTILGDPVNLSNQIPSDINGDETAIFYGDYKFILLGYKTGQAGITVDVSNCAVISDSGQVIENLWTQGETGYRFDKRQGILVAVPEAFSVGTGIK